MGLTAVAMAAGTVRRFGFPSNHALPGVKFKYVPALHAEIPTSTTISYYRHFDLTHLAYDLSLAKPLRALRLTLCAARR